MIVTLRKERIDYRCLSTQNSKEVHVKTSRTKKRIYVSDQYTDSLNNYSQNDQNVWGHALDIVYKAVTCSRPQEQYILIVRGKKNKKQVSTKLECDK